MHKHFFGQCDRVRNGQRGRGRGGEEDSHMLDTIMETTIFKAVESILDNQITT